MIFETDIVDFLTPKFLDESDEIRSGALPSRKRMEVFLRFVGDPDFQSTIHNPSSFVK